jgi:hypothetical protein
MVYNNIRNVLKRVEKRLDSKTYKINNSAYKHNKKALQNKKRTSKNNIKTKINNYIKKMELQKLPEVVYDADLEDEAEEAEPLVGSCSKSGKDTYTPEVLKEEYKLHMDYVNSRIKSAERLKIKVRLPHIPEDISENIIKFIIHNHLNDESSTWNCKSGDLHSKIEGVQECKAFTSDGPLSFSPSSDWNIIYFLDARNWLSDRFVLYKANLKKSDKQWMDLKMSQSQTFEHQAKAGRRPRINWKRLSPQLEGHCKEVFNGTFDDIFIKKPVKEVEPTAEQ